MTPPAATAFSSQESVATCAAWDLCAAILLGSTLMRKTNSKPTPITMLTNPTLNSPSLCLPRNKFSSSNIPIILTRSTTTTMLRVHITSSDKIQMSTLHQYMLKIHTLPLLIRPPHFNEMQTSD
jgi:hypothetical protein